MRALGKIIIFIIVPFFTFGQKLTYIPDNNFEQKLIHLEYDDVLDNWVLTESIDTITSLTVNWEWISDLTGIEDFISLIYLDCSGNDLAELNVSNNINLTHLDCHWNNLTELDLSDNINLTHLDTYFNDSIGELNLSNNTSLLDLNCNGNNLSELNLSSNTELTHLNCGNTNISSLDVSNNLELVYLQFGVSPTNNAKLLELDVTNNLNLKLLDIYEHNLSELDVSNNTELIHLSCYNNNLTELDVSKNTELIRLYCSGNNIECVQVWDVDYAIEQTYSFMNENNEVMGPYFNSGDAIWSLDCEYPPDNLIEKVIIKKVDILGRDSNSRGLNIEIYDDGTAEKKYIIK